MVDEEPADEEPNGTEDDADSAYVPRVVVKFNDGEQLPYEDRLDRVLRERFPDLWEQQPRQTRDSAINRLFSSVTPERLEELTRESGNERNYLAYFEVLVPPEVSPEELARALRAWPIIETAYVEDELGPPPTTNARIVPAFHGAAPNGIGVPSARPLLGGDGTGVAIIDVEQGWTLNHEDLVGKGITIISGDNRDHLWHGTAVLGIIVAEDNAKGVVGIAPGAKASVVSQWRTASDKTGNIADAITLASDVLSLGDVLLLEAQRKVPSPGHPGQKILVPVETDEATFKAIVVATGRNIVVVEAAGNSKVDLDLDARFPQLNRNNPAFRDTLAIMVGAAFKDTRARWSVPASKDGSNFGSRVDCYAWGNGIDTSGKDPTVNPITDYTKDFGGTSGASAIIAGVALAIQGIAQHRPGGRLLPDQLRARFQNPALGTPSQNPAVDRIGPMPNLKAIIADLPAGP